RQVVQPLAGPRQRRGERPGTLEDLADPKLRAPEVAEARLEARLDPVAAVERAPHREDVRPEGAEAQRLRGVGDRPPGVRGDEAEVVVTLLSPVSAPAQHPEGDP